MTNYLIRLFTLITLSLLPFLSFGQEDKESGENEQEQEPDTSNNKVVRTSFEVVNVDLNSGTFLQPLPFDVPFLIEGTAYEKLIKVSACYKCYKNFNVGYVERDNFKCKGDDKKKLSNWENLFYNENNNNFYFLVPPLEAKRHYNFRFNFTRYLTTDEKKELKDQIQAILTNELENLKIEYNGNIGPDESKFSEIEDKIISYLKRDLKSKNLECSSEDCFDKISNIIPRSAFEYSKANTLREDYETNTRNIIVISLEEKLNFDNLEVLYLELPIKPFDPFPYIDKLNKLKNEIENSGNIDDNTKSTLNRNIDANKNLVVYYNKKLKERNQKISTAIQYVFNNIFFDVIATTTVTGNSIGSFQTRAKNYFSADLGVAFIPTINRASPYVGTNIYLAPVNKDAPLSTYGLKTDDENLKDKLKKLKLEKRFSFLFGLTFISLAENGMRENLLSNFNLLTGAGLRLTDAIRLNGGWIWLRRNDNDSNPLVSSYRLQPVSFVSLSFDIDVRTVLDNLFKPNSYGLSLVNQ